MNECNVESLVDLVKYQASKNEDKLAFQYLERGEEEAGGVLYGELLERCQIFSSSVKNIIEPDSNVVLLMPTSIDFVVSFFGLMFFQCRPVPVGMPKPNRGSWSRIKNIINDSCSSVVITNRSNKKTVQNWLSSFGLNDISVLACEDLFIKREKECLSVSPQKNDICFIQYTSGSTGSPKGVMVSHGNLLHNSALNKKQLGHDESTRIVSWLPLFHDLGLIGNLIQTLYIGGTCYFMLPHCFVERPIRWLSAVTKYKATTIMAPNFAFELCVKKISDEEKSNLDLSSLKSVLNGAESIRSETLKKFTEYFSSCGLSRVAMLPAYGLAEATLIVSSSHYSDEPYCLRVCSDSLERGVFEYSESGVELVSSGNMFYDQEVCIVDPDTEEGVKDGDVGEVWIKGGSVCQGYWNNPVESKKTFQAYTREGLGPFLRTGDLGILDGGHLFIASRLKDLMIFNGRNVYPQDIEKAVEEASDEIRDSFVSAFSIEAHGEEKLVVVAEVSRKVFRDKSGLADTIAALVVNAIGKEFDVWPHDVVLIRPASLPKTSSGKVQRQLAKKMYLNNELDSTSKELKKNVSQSSGEWGDAPVYKSRVAWIRAVLPTSYNAFLADERRTLPPNVILGLGNQGLLGMIVPKEYGGLGFNLCQSMKIVEQLGRVDQSVALLVLLNNLIGIRPILQFGSESTKQKVLPGLAAGRLLSSFAMSEPGAGSNPQNISATANYLGVDKWFLSGEKVWSGNSGWATLTNVFVKHKDEHGRPAGITAFLLNREKHSLQVGEEALTMGMRGIIQNSLVLDGAIVDSSDVLGVEGKGMDVAQDAMSLARLGVAAAALGGMKRAIQLSDNYVQNRSISTGKLVENPVAVVVRNQAVLSIKSTEHLLFKVTELLDQGICVPPVLLSACKVASSEWLWSIVDAALQLLGGRGYIETNGMAQLMRDARVMRIFEGPTETLSAHIGSVLKTGYKDVEQFISKYIAPGCEIGAIKDGVDKIMTIPLSSVCFSNAKQEMEWREQKLGAWFIYYVFSIRSCRVGDSASEAFCRRLAETEIESLKSVNSLILTNQELDARIDEVIGDMSVEPGTPYPDVVGDRLSQYGSIDVDSSVVSKINKDFENKESQQSIKFSEETKYSYQKYLNYILSWLCKNLECSEEKIEPTSSFFKLGINSVSATELVFDLRAEFDVKLDVTQIWDYVSPSALSDYMCSNHKEESSLEDLADQLRREISAS